MPASPLTDGMFAPRKRWYAAARSRELSREAFEQMNGAE